MQDQTAAIAPTEQLETCPLSALPAGAGATVVDLSTGAEVRRRMATLGFTPGTEITMVQNPRHGPLIVSVRNIRIALGRGEAQKVQVRRHV